MSFSFKEPQTYEQLEAVGRLAQALFLLAQTYGVEPAKLLNDAMTTVEWKVEAMIDSKIKSKDEPKPGDPDKPIDLDDIPF